MKDFMLIFKGAEQQYNFSPEQMQQHMQNWFGWIESLKAKNLYISGEALLPGGKKVSGSKKLITDGPFAESKELVGGFVIIRVASFEEAAEMATGCPDLALEGVVEVREVMKFD